MLLPVNNEEVAKAGTQTRGAHPMQVAAASALARECATAACVRARRTCLRILLCPVNCPCQVSGRSAIQGPAMLLAHWPCTTCMPLAAPVPTSNLPCQWVCTACMCT